MTDFVRRHPMMSGIAALFILFLAFLQVTNLQLSAQDADTESWFSLTSEKTFMTGEKPEIGVNAHNVKQLEFRVYRVNDPVKFFSQMEELHNFGGTGPAMPKQAHTWLEKFHAWKHRIWDPRLHPRAVLARLASRDPPVADGRSSEDKGPASRKLRADPGAQPTAGCLGLDMERSSP